MRATAPTHTARLRPASLPPTTNMPGAIADAASFADLGRQAFCGATHNTQGGHDQVHLNLMRLQPGVRICVKFTCILLCSHAFPFACHPLHIATRALAVAPAGRQAEQSAHHCHLHAVALTMLVVPFWIAAQVHVFGGQASLG